MPFAVSPELDRLVQERLASGAYPTAEALLIEALRALDELEAQQAELQRSVAARRARAQQGLAQPFDLPQFLEEARPKR
jgi:putative addiction module CopG family antidote